MFRVVRTPNPGDAVRAGDLREMAEELRRGRLSVCPPLMLDRGPGGTVVRMAGAPVGGATLGGAWGIGIAGGTATCVSCAAQVSSVTVMAAAPGSLSVALGMTAGDVFLCGVLNTETRALSLEVGEPPAAVDAESEKVYFLLYKLSCSGSAWTVKTDYRMMPRLAVYV